MHVNVSEEEKVVVSGDMRADSSGTVSNYYAFFQHNIILNYEVLMIPILLKLSSKHERPDKGKPT